jgi:hypothetical protein
VVVLRGSTVLRESDGVALVEPLVTVAAVFAALSKAPRHTTDRDEEQHARDARMMQLATVVAIEAKTPEIAALLVTVARHESTLARYIAEGRCSDGPKGQQCDGLRSRGYFQNRLVSCKKGWFAPPGSHAELVEMARCSVRDLRRGWKQCGTAEGAFAAFNGSRSCSAPWAKSRVAMFGKVLGQLKAEGPKS